VVSCQEKRYHAEVARVNLDTVPEHLQTVYEWQRNKNEYFLDPSTSPLRAKEKKKFDGLEFFYTNVRLSGKGSFPRSA
jgi:hypothetical protein